MITPVLSKWQDIKQFLEFNYSYLGTIVSAIELDGKMSNLFKVTFKKGDIKTAYCFKISSLAEDKICYFTLPFNSRLHYQAELISFCNKKGLKIPNLIKTNDKTYFKSTKSDIMMLYEFADGPLVGNAIINEYLSPNTVQLIGHWLGQFHACSQGLTMHPTPNRLTPFIFHKKVEALENTAFQKQVHHLKSQIQTHLNSCLEAKELKEWVIGPIHGDFHAGNLLLGNTLSVIDWELCGLGPRLLDIGTIIRSLKLSLDSIWLIAKSYSEGYTSDKKLRNCIREQVIKHARTFAEVRHIWFFAMHYDHQKELSWKYPFW